MTARTQLRLTFLRATAAALRPLRPVRSLALPAQPRILLIRPDHIGDLLFLTPTLHVLDEALPAAHLALIVGPWGKGVVGNNPHIDELLECEFPAFTRRDKGSWLAPYAQLMRWAARIRAHRFDAAVILRFDHWWGALLAYLAGIPHRVGYDIPECAPFLTEGIPYVERRHEVLQNLALAERLLPADLAPRNASSLALEFFPTAQDASSAEAWLANASAADGGWIALHPGAGAAVKQWSVASFAALGDALVARYDVQIVLTGGPDEVELARAVAGHMQSRAAIAAGATTLGQLAALYRCCRLVIGADSGPLHLAVAVGTPTVHLYGPVDVAKFGPWGPAVRHIVLTSGRDCIPCNRLDYVLAELNAHPCVREIRVERVVAAAGLILSAGR